jgi:phospholipase A-2-activating protein
MPKYKLSQTLITDGEPVRALAATNSHLITGSESGILSAIALAKSSKKTSCSTTDIAIQPGGEGTRHSHHITALIRIPWNQNGGYITGCKDNIVRVFDENHKLSLMLKGHDNAVTSLSWLQVPELQHPLLVSGSWDGTAKLWSVELGQCLATLPGHENTVSVQGLPPSDNIARLATGSAGLAHGNNIIDHKIRLWDVLYDNKAHAVQVQLKTTVANDHNGPIRDLVFDQMSQMLLSCSNDGTVKVRDTITGEVVTTLFFPLENVQSSQPPMLLSVDSIGGGKVLACSEDGNAVVWDVSVDAGENSVQVIPHPGCVWDIMALDNGDFVTACHDGCIRVFSEDPEKEASEAERAAFQEAVIQNSVKHSSGPSAQEIAALPKWEQNASVFGKSDGQVQLFQKNGKAIAAQWSVASVTWIEVGEVTGQNTNTGTIDGVEYDHVFPIEVDVPGGGVQNLQIGYNDGQNPFTVAQNFIDEHMLNQAYLAQIADYIRSRVGEGAGPTLGMQNASESSVPATSGMAPMDITTDANRPDFKYFPMIGYKCFDTGSDTNTLSKICKKIREFNLTLNSNLSPDEASTELDHLCATISATNRYHATTISDVEMNIIYKMIKHWSLLQVFPAIDLARLVAIHPDASKPSRSSYWEEIIELVLDRCEQVRKTNTGSPAVPMLSFRLFSNCFRGGVGSQAGVVSNLTR